MKSLAAILLLVSSYTFAADSQLSSGAQPGAQPVIPQHLGGTPQDVATPDVEDLGEGHYRIGNIAVNTNKRSFTVSGTVLDLDLEDAPIEFLAVTKGGMKAYEALLELDVNAFEFNLACILIGLDHKNAARPQHHFDPAKVTGDTVDIRVDWTIGNKKVSREIGELIRDGGGGGEHVWVYTGSVFTSDGTLLAALMGTLIGVVHDPDSIIQHQLGMGLGHYGTVVANRAAGPPPGTVVNVTVAFESN
jgi:hypothetical protein